MPDVTPNASTGETNLAAAAVPDAQPSGDAELTALVAQLRAENESRQAENEQSGDSSEQQQEGDGSKLEDGRQMTDNAKFTQGVER